MPVGHTHAPKGKRVIVHMRDGTKRIGKFKKTEGNCIYLEDQEPIRTKKVRCLSIWKNQTIDRNM